MVYIVYIDHERRAYADQYGSSACADEPFTKVALGAESQGGEADDGGALASRWGTLFA